MTEGKHGCYICDAPLRMVADAYVCDSCVSVRTVYSYDASIYGKWYHEHYLKNAKTDIAHRLYLHRLGVVARFLGREGKLLDIGCCNGDWLRYVSHFYDNAVGLEPNPYALAEAQKNLGSRRAVASIHDLEKTCVLQPPFDVVTMFDVIEHLEDPRSSLRHIADRLLVKGGFLVIVTPSIDSVLEETYVADKALLEWKHYKPREHLFLYSLQALARLLGQCGFRLGYFDYLESRIRPGNPQSDIMTAVFQLGVPDAA